MLYRKNLYTWEQALRIVASLGAIAYALLGAWGSVLGYALLVAGVTGVVTGLVGWCPACAMFGKTLKT